MKEIEIDFFNGVAIEDVLQGRHLPEQDIYNKELDRILQELDYINFGG